MDSETIFTPGEVLVAELEQLRSLLNKLHDRLNESGVERTFHLRRIMGKDCTYLKKSMSIFVDEDFEPLRDLVKQIDSQFKLIEGHQDGRK